MSISEYPAIRTAEELQRQVLALQAMVELLLPAATLLQAKAEAIQQNTRRAASVNRIYTDDDRARWKALAQAPDMHRHSRRSAARLIAQREGLPLGAAETIRRAI